MKLKAGLGLAVVLLLGTGSTAYGQFRTSFVSRPSEQGPSSRIGRVGGRATQLSVMEIGARAPGGGAARPIIGTFGLGSDPEPFDLPRAVLPSRVGRSFPWNRRAPLVGFGGRYSEVDMRMVSGLDTALSLSLPLLGVESPRVRPAPMNYVPPPAAPSPFHEFFQLRPAPEAQEPAGQLEPSKTLAERLADWNERTVDLTMARALRAFKTATSPGAVAPREEMARAVSMLEGLRAVRRDDYVPDLLLLHAALARSQIATAGRHLLELVLRRPAFFQERPDVASYFGDPKLLEEQMNAYVRVGDENPHAPEAQALQAYCAFILGDTSRVRLTLDAMSKLEAQRSAEVDRALRIAFAIRAGLK